MEPLTHLLSGAALAKLGFKRKHTLPVLLFISIAPDLDYITRFWGMDVFLRYHRGITHGVAALAVVPVLMGLLFYRKGFFYFFFVSLLGYSLHLALDLTNQYGTRVLSPLDWSMYSFDLVAIFDPYVVGIFALGLLYMRKLRKPALAAVLVFALVGSYIGLRAYLHERSEDFLQAKLPAKRYMVCPLPNDSLRWWFVAETETEIITGFSDLFSGRVFIADRYPLYRRGTDPVIESSYRSRVVGNFLYFAKYPYPELRKEGGGEVVVWKELSYSFLPGDRFAVRVVMRGTEPVSASFKF